MGEQIEKVNAMVCANINQKFQLQLINLAIASFQELNFNNEGLEVSRVECNISENDFNELVKTYTAIVTMFMELDKGEFQKKLLSKGFSQEFIDKLPLTID